MFSVIFFAVYFRFSLCYNVRPKGEKFGSNANKAIKKEWSPPTILCLSIPGGEKYYFPFTSFSKFLLNFVYV